MGKAPMARVRNSYTSCQARSNGTVLAESFVPVGHAARGSPPLLMKAALLSPSSGVFLFVRYAAVATLLMAILNAAI